jgi:hypothetical protein
MSEMVERIAASIKTKAWSLDLPLRDEECADLARAAIAAMREPTEAMLNVGYTTGGNYKPTGTLREWQAMIDEALK